MSAGALSGSDRYPGAIMPTDIPNLDFALEITTAFYRQLSPNFPMSRNPIHIDSSRIVGKEVEVIWAYFDRYWDGDSLVFGMRFTVVIEHNFWLEEQAKLLLQLEVVA